MSPRTIFELLKDTYNGWSEDNASRLAAALAYYTVFSLAPLLLIAISVAGLVFGEKAAQGQVFAQLQGLLGPEAAQTIQSAIEKSSNTGASMVSTIIGLVTLVLGASGVFGELQSGLDTVWEVQPTPGGGILATVKRRFLSMTMVLGIGFLLLVSLLLSAAVSTAGHLLGDALPGGEALWQAVNFVLSLAIMTLLFGAIYKVLPDVEIGWRDVWVGAAITAVLFTVGKTLIGLYLGHSSVGSAYGAAGSLLVLLVWVYYSAQILYFGAELTQAWASKYGTRIVPSAGAVPLTEAARAQQGIPRAGAAEAAARSGRSAEAEAEAEAGRRTPGAAGRGARAGRASAQIQSGPIGVQVDRDAVKKTLWAALSAGTLALAGLLAHQISAALWRTLRHEPPPTSKA